SGTGRAPATDTEKTIAAVFTDVLALDDDTELSIDDDFFHLGGDSILSIQLVTRARKMGVAFTAADVFAARTIAGLATIADTVDDDASATVLTPVRDAVVLPIAQRKVGTPGFDHFTQGFCYVTPAGLSTGLLSQVLSLVINHHPVLTGRLYQDTSTHQWRFALGGADTGDSGTGTGDLIPTVTDRITTDHTNLSWDSDQWRNLIRDITTELSATMDPANGDLWAARWVTSDTEPDGRLVFVIHHLVVDGVSWRILADDLTHAWDLATGRTDAPLPDTGTTVTTWSDALSRRVNDTGDNTITDQAGYWTDVVTADDPLLGARALDPALDTTGTTGHARVSLDSPTTRKLLSTLPGLLSADVNDILLGSLTTALGAWRAARGDAHRRTLIGLEGHGREETLVPGADLSRTIGWFTSWYPVALSTDDIDPTTAVDDPAAAADAVLRVKEHLAAVPDRGIGYGLLRYLNPDTANRLATGRTPQIGFNYLGQFTSGTNPTGTNWSGAPESPGLTGHADSIAAAPAVIDINMSATGTSSTDLTLSGGVSYATGILSADDIDDLICLWTRALVTLADYATNTDTVRRSPSDVLADTVTQADLDTWQHIYGALADVQPLSPLQQGLVFHAALSADDADSTDLYVVQNVLRLTGTVDPDRMDNALVSTLRRYPNLTAAITTGATGDYYAVLPVDVPPRFDHVDLAGTTDTAAAGVTDRWQDLGFDEVVNSIADDQRSLPFDLTDPPLLRLVLVTDHDRAAVVLTKHHTLTDGWSSPLLVRCLLDSYAHPDQTVQPDQTYTRFLEWLGDKNPQTSLDTWSGVLATVDDPTLVGIPDADTTGFPDEHHLSLDSDKTRSLSDLARVTGTTLATIVQTAWGVTLNSVTGQDTVIFGAAVSGRPADIDGIEDAVGLFINTIAVPVDVTGNPTLTGLITRTQATNTAVLDDHHIPLPDIHRITGHNPLFDTLLAYENFPSAKGDNDGVGDLSLDHVTGRDSTHYPVSIAVLPSDTLGFRFTHHPEALPAGLFDQLVSVFVGVLDTMATAPDTRVGDLDVLTDADRDNITTWSVGEEL
ncbi:condensation domain-containing protein, partial [Corynebacterium neomassiliense]|uniref:condensation domain-containing protein n=1 Tax=Corynebacterium neomassiliense TaxID=2079482 RepID=UPI001F3B233F